MRSFTVSSTREAKQSWVYSQLRLMRSFTVSSTREANQSWVYSHFKILHGELNQEAKSELSLLTVWDPSQVSSTRKQIRAELAHSMRSFPVSSTRKQIRAEFTHSMRSFTVNSTRKQIRAEFTHSMRSFASELNEETNQSWAYSQ